MTMWNIYQHQQIRGVRLQQSAVDRERLNRDGRVNDEIEQLHERIDRLSLLTKAMWIVMQRRGTTNEELLAELDSLLGQQMAVAEARMCPDCSSKVAPDLDRCTYCGKVMPVPFDPFHV